MSIETAAADSLNQATRPSDLPDIPAPGATSITYTTPSPTLRTTPFSSSATATSTRVTATSSPTSSVSSKHSGPSGLSNGAKAAAIAIPLVFLLLLVPLVYLVVRSHQMRKASEKRASQRESQQAMIQQQQQRPETSNSVSQKAAFQVLAGDQTPQQKSPQRQQRKPVNSLGLFNFEFSNPGSPLDRKSVASRLSRPLSLVHLKSSKGHIPDGGLGLDARFSPTMSTPSETHKAQHSPRSPLNPHFAPLNQIGIAHTKDGRPRTNRSPPRGGEDHSGQNVPVRNSKISRSSQQVERPLPDLPPATRSSSRRSSTSQHDQGLGRQPSAVSYGERSSNPFTNSRYSDVSAISDEGNNRRSSNVFPSYSEGAGTQPYRLV